MDTKLALYWGQLPSEDQSLTFDDTIDAPILTFPVERDLGSYGPIHISPGQYGPIPAGADVLMVVADPDRLLPTTKDDLDFAFLHLADISLDDVSFDEGDQTVTVDYAIGGYDLLQPSSIDLYWASGTTPSTALGGRAYRATTETSTGDHTLTVPETPSARCGGGELSDRSRRPR